MSELENEHSDKHSEKSAEEPKKRRRFRWLSVFLGVLLIIAVNLQLALKYYSDVIIKRLLQEAVALKSNGMYSLDFEEGSFSFFEQEFNIKHLSFKLNEARWQQLKSQNVNYKLLYEFEIPEIALSAGSLREAWFQKKWTIENFYIKQPKVRIKAINKAESSSNIKAETNLFFLISGYLNEFKIENFSLEKADISYSDVSENTYNIRDIDLDIVGFKVDSTSILKDNKPFYLEDLACSIGKNQLSLPTGISVEFESLSGSISSEKFNVNDFKIVTSKNAPKAMADKNLAFGALKVEGLKYDRFYFDSVFQAKSITLQKPFIDLGQLQKTTSTTTNVLTYKSVSQYLKGVIVGSILLDSAAIYAKTPTNQVAVDDFSLLLENFWYNENSWQARKKRLFIDDFELNVRNYIADLPDGIHQFKALRLGLSSKRRYAYGNNVLIVPAKENIGYREAYELNQDKLINFYLSRIELTGLDVWGAYINQKLRVSTFRVNRPRLEINHLVNLKTGIDTLFQEDSLNMFLEDVQIDSLLDSDTLNSSLNDSLLVDSINMPISISEASLPTIDSLLNKTGENEIIEKTDTIPKNTTFTSYLLNYFDSAFTARDDSMQYLVMLDSINNLDRDSLLLANIVKGINTTFLSAKINTIDVNEAQFMYFECAEDTLKRFAIENTNVTLDDLFFDETAYADSSRLLFSKEMNIEVEKLDYSLPDSLHAISIKNLYISSSDSIIKAKETWLKPYQRNQNFIVENIGKTPAIFDIRLKSFFTNKINFRDIFREQRVLIEELNIEKPNILQFVPLNLPAISQDTTSLLQEEPPYLEKEIKFSKELPVWQPTLSDYLKTFGIKSINFNEGFYSLAEVSDRTRELLSARDIQLCVRDLTFDSTLLLENEILPLVSDAELLTNNYFINLPDNIHTLQSKSLGVSLSSSSVYLYNTKIKPSVMGRRKKGVNKYNITMPEFRLDGVDWQRLYFDRELYVRELLINNPSIAVNTVYSKDINEPQAITQKDSTISIESDEIFTAKMREAVLSVLNSVEIDRTNLNRGIADWKQLEDRSIRQHARTDRLDLAINTFKIDASVSPVPKHFLFAFDVRFNARNVIHDLPDQWHSIRSSRVEFSSDEKTFFATYLHYAPKNWADFNFIQGNKARKNVSEVYTPLLSVKGTELQKILTENKLVINEVSLEEPKVRLVRYPEEKEKTTNEKFNTQKLDEILKKNFEEVQVNKFHFDNASIQIGIHPKDRESTYFDFDNLFTKVSNFSNQSAKFDSLRFMLADDIHVGLRDYALDLPDSIYRLKADEIGFSTGRKAIYLKQLDVKPKVSKKAIAEIHGNEIDWMHFKSDSIILTDFNFPSFIESNKLIANRLDIENLDTYVYRDKRPPSAFGRKPPLPQQFLRNAKTYIKLDTVNLYNSKVTYEELASDGKQPGQIYIDNLNAYAFNVTNDTALLAQGAAVQVFANGSLMGEGRLEASFNFPIANENNSFTYRGSLEPMDLRAINPMLENVAFLKVNSGISKKLTFEVQADEEYADGFMRFYYRDLNVALLKADAKPKKQGKIRSFLTMFANVLVKSNSRRFLFLKRGKIYAERDKSKSIFNYWAKTLLSGVKHSVGFSYDKPPRERRKSVFQFWKRKRKDFRRIKKARKVE